MLISVNVPKAYTTMTYINHRGVHNCCICQKPVLRLEGEYRFMDTYNMGEKLLATGLFGDCHVKCLAVSPVKEEWYELTLYRYTMVNRMDCETLDAGGAVFTGGKHYVCYGASGSLVDLTENDLKQLKKGDGVYLLSIETELEITFHDAAFEKDFLQQLKTNKTAAVWPLAEHLQITGQFYHPALMQQAKLVFDRSLARHWEYGQYLCRCVYNVAIEEEAVKKIRELS